MPAFEDLQNLQAQLIRKALGGSVFIAESSVALPATLTTGASAALAALPSGWEDLGYLTKSDGATWARSTELSDVTSWGALEPTRSDISSDTSTLQVTAQETKRLTIELYENVDLSALTPTAVTGEIQFSKPTRPATRYFRLFAICVDGVGDDAIYIGKLAPRAQITEAGEQTWSDGDDPISYPLTFGTKVDSIAGTSMKYYFGGPGWRSALESMNFTALTNEVQTITEGGTGLTSFTLTYAAQTTGAIAAAATAATVQAALEALSNIAPGDVTVTGSAGGPYTVTFGGTLANTNVAQMTATPTGGSGTVTVATTTEGGA